MPIRMSCPNCRMLYNVPENLAGKQIRCKKCSHVFSASPPSQQEAIVVQPILPTKEEEILQVLPVTKTVEAAKAGASGLTADSPLRMPGKPMQPVMPAAEQRGFNITTVPGQLLYPPAPDLKEVLKDPTTEVIYQNPFKILLYLVLVTIAAVVLLVVGIVVFLIFFILGGFILLLSGLCWLAVPFLAISVFDRSPKLVFTEQGFFNCLDGKEEYIAWLRIKEMELLQTDLLVILVDENGKEWDREIPFDALRSEPRTIARKMEQYMEQAREEFMKGSR